MSKKINLKIYNTSTLKQTSKDDNNEEYMTESQIKVINFDSVGGDKYTRNNNLRIQLKTNDVLFLHSDRRYTFIEFKNGKLLDKTNKIDIKKFDIVDDEKFVLDFLREKRVLLVHGRGFNYPEPDHFRIVYLPRIEDLKKAANKLENFLSSYKQKH